MTRKKHCVGNIYKTNSYGDAELLEIKGKLAKIRFITTGYEREVNIDNLVAGKVRDYSAENPLKNSTEYPNTLHKSNSCGDFLLIEKTSNSCLIQFVNTGFIKKVDFRNIKSGKVSDPYYKSRYNIGYLGEFEKTSYWKQAKQLWNNMMKRCYSESDIKGYYGTCFVDDRWLCFSNFLSDLPLLENFELWLEGQKNNSTKYNLDKDFKIPENNVYSREACMFLPETLNKSMGAANGKPFSKNKVDIV